MFGRLVYCFLAFALYVRVLGGIGKSTQVQHRYGFAEMASRLPREAGGVEC